MCGNQFGFHYKSIYDIEKLFSIVKNKIAESLQGYGLSHGDIASQQLNLKVVYVKLLSEFSLGKAKLDIASCEQSLCLARH